MNDDAIERLETKIAWLEQSTQELSDTVYRQERELEQMKSRVGALMQEMETLRGSTPGAPRTAAEEKPPHY